MSDKPRTCATCKYNFAKMCGNLKAVQHYRSRVEDDHACDRHRHDPNKEPGKWTMIVCKRGR